MSDIWCYKIDCIHNNNSIGEDKDGKFGTCLVKDIIVDRNGKCNIYETIVGEEWEKLKNANTKWNI